MARNISGCSKKKKKKEKRYCLYEDSLDDVRAEDKSDSRSPGNPKRVKRRKLLNSEPFSGRLFSRD